MKRTKTWKKRRKIHQYFVSCLLINGCLYLECITAPDLFVRKPRQDMLKKKKYIHSYLHEQSIDVKVILKQEREERSCPRGTRVIRTVLRSENCKGKHRKKTRLGQDYRADIV